MYVEMIEGKRIAVEVFDLAKINWTEIKIDVRKSRNVVVQASRVSPWWTIFNYSVIMFCRSCRHLAHNNKLK